MMVGAHISNTSFINYGTVLLYNNSNYGSLLAVWSLEFNTSGSGKPYGGYYTGDGSVGTDAASFTGQLGTTQPYVTRSGARAGQIRTLDAAAQTLYREFNYQLVNEPLYDYTLNFPMAILQPGTYLAAQDNATGDTLYVQFVWEEIHLADLAGEPCEHCDAVIVVT